MPPAWADAGASWGHDMELCLPPWRRGFQIGELQALFFSAQRADTLERERNAARRDLESLEGQIERLERSVWWYRSQLVAEARLGPMLAALAHRPGKPGAGGLSHP